MQEAEWCVLRENVPRDKVWAGTLVGRDWSSDPWSAVRFKVVLCGYADAEGIVVETQRYGVRVRWFDSVPDCLFIYEEERR